MSTAVKNIAERAIRGAGIAYVASWSALGLGYDGLFTLNNAKQAVVGAVISLALSLGFLKAGDKTSGGLF